MAKVKNPKNKEPRKIKMQMEIVEGKGRMIVDFDGPPAAMYCCSCCCYRDDDASFFKNINVDLNT